MTKRSSQQKPAPSGDRENNYLFEWLRKTPIAAGGIAFATVFLSGLILLLAFRFSSGSADPVNAADSAPNGLQNGSSGREADSTATNPSVVADSKDGAVVPAEQSSIAPPSQDSDQSTKKTSAATIDSQPSKQREAIVVALSEMPEKLLTPRQPSGPGSPSLEKPVGNAGVSEPSVPAVDDTGFENMDLPFRVAGICTSPTDSAIVVWGYDWSDEKLKDGHFFDVEPKNSAHVAVLDSKEQKILKQRVFNGMIDSAAIVDGTLFLAAPYSSRQSDSNAVEMPVLQVRLDDLQIIDRFHLQPGTLVAAGRYLVVTGQEREAPVRYQLPTLDMLPPQSEVFSLMTMTSGFPQTGRLRDGWLMDGVLWNTSDFKPRLILEFSPFQAAAKQRPVQIPMIPVFRGSHLYSENSRLVDFRGAFDERPQLLPDLLLPVSIKKTEIHLADPTSTDTATVLLGALKNINVPPSVGEGAKFSSCPNSLQVIRRGELFLRRLDPDDPVLGKPPFQIVPEQTKFLLPLKGMTKIAYSAPEASKYELKLSVSLAGATDELLTSESGEFKIDLSELSINVSEMFRVPIHNKDSKEPAPSHPALTYTASVTSLFERITGREPNGIPLSVTARVRALGKNLQTAVLEHQFIVEVPFEDCGISDRERRDWADRQKKNQPPPVIRVKRQPVAEGPEDRDEIKKDVVEVKTPPLSLTAPFPVMSASISPDGRHALLTSAGVPARVAILDLEAMKISAETSVQDTILEGRIGNKSVYVLMQDGVEEWEIEGLKKTREAAFGFSVGQDTRLTFIDGRYLNVAGEIMRLNQPEFEFVKRYAHDNTPGGLTGPTAFGWLEQGILWDPEWKKPQLMIWPDEFRRTEIRLLVEHSFSPLGQRWHPFRSRIADVHGPGKGFEEFVNCLDFPIFARIASGKDGASLHSYDLKTARRLATVQLSTQALPDRPAGILFGGGRYLAYAGDTLYSGLTEELSVGAEVPFHIVPVQSTFELSTKSSTQVSYSAAGATRFRLQSHDLLPDRKLVTLESSDGVFELPAALSVEILIRDRSRILRMIQYNEQQTQNTTPTSFEESVNAWQRIFGKKPEGVPIPITVTVVAEGNGFETAVLQHEYFVFIPFKVIEDAKLQ